MRRRVSGLTAILALSLAAPIDAQWIVAAYGGAVHTQPADVRLRQPDRSTDARLSRVRFESESFKAPVYYGYRIARVVSARRRVFLEAELIHAKAFAQDAKDVQRLAMSHGLNFVLVNVGVRRPLGARLSATARAGAGPMVPHVEAEIGGSRTDAYQLAGVGVQTALGAELKIWRRVSLLAEYKWTRAVMRLSLPAARASLAPTSHHVALGLAAAVGGEKIYHKRRGT
jgi:hypothetical protein